MFMDCWHWFWLRNGIHWLIMTHPFYGSMFISFHKGVSIHGGTTSFQISMAFSSESHFSLFFGQPESSSIWWMWASPCFSCHINHPLTTGIPGDGLVGLWPPLVMVFSHGGAVLWRPLIRTQGQEPRNWSSPARMSGSPSECCCCAGCFVVVVGVVVVSCCCCLFTA